MTDQTEYHHVFGFGSIINTTTHAPWLAADSKDTTLLGQRATILESFGFTRGWNFRSATGFTALGITRKEEEASDVNGVLFRITKEMLSGFDRREVGYDRVNIPLDQLRLINPSSD